MVITITVNLSDSDSFNNESTPLTHYSVVSWPFDGLRPRQGTSGKSVQLTSLNPVVLVTRHEDNEEGWRAFLTAASRPLYYYDGTSDEKNEDGADPPKGLN